MIHVAIDTGVKRVVFPSTDKAAYPINAMGNSISKIMIEHVIYANARVSAERGSPIISVTMYGNVMRPRGSVILLFINQPHDCNLIKITDRNMTRFLMNPGKKVDFVKNAFEHVNSTVLFIQKADVNTIGNLAKTVQHLFGDTGTNLLAHAL